MLPRTITAEILDGLSETNSAAIRSRHDLRRVHRVMGTSHIVVRALRSCGAPGRTAAALRVLELGAGDGSLMLRIARAMQWEWPAVHLTLLDRLNLVDTATIANFAHVGWTARSAVVDVLDWAAGASNPWPGPNGSDHWDLIVANLFLHHFDAPQLGALLSAIALRTDRFLACEPRRGWVALCGSHLVGAMGATAVTRTDAVLSVHAGFRDKELTALWMAETSQFRVNEYSAGLFSHCFYTERCGPTPTNH